MDRHIIDEVEEEVAIWAKERDKEIENLKKLEAYRRDFLGNVSHELKTPIFNVQGYIETLIESKLEDENINLPYLKRAARNVERLSTIAQDLDMIAQLESEDLYLDIQSFDIHELANEIFEETGIIAREKRIKFNFKQGCDRPFLVKADRERIRQVFVNLITNSVKYDSSISSPIPSNTVSLTAIPKSDFTIWTISISSLKFLMMDMVLRKSTYRACLNVSIE